MKKLEITEVASTDARILADLLTDAVRRKLERGDHAWGSGVYSEDEVLRLMAKSPTYLVRKNGEVAGTVALQWQDVSVWGDQPQNAGYIHRLAVKHGFEGHGLGAQIIDWAGSRVAQNRRRFIRLDCDSHNIRLCAYYERLGFIRVGTKQMPAGGGYVAALYERPVPGA